MWKNKKAQGQTELWEVLLQAVLVVGACVGLLLYVNSLYNNTLFEKIHESRDFALMTNTIFSSPESTRYVHLFTKTTKFNYSFNQQKVGIGEGKARPILFPYGENLFFNTQLSQLQTPTQIEFTNFGYGFNIDEIAAFQNTKSLKYPYLELNTNDKKINIISSMSKKQDGTEYIESYAERVKQALISSVKEIKVSKDARFENLYPERRFALASEIDADIIIIINSNKEQDTLKVYIPSNPETIKQSRIIASKTINNIISKEKFKQLNPLIIPIKSNSEKIIIDFEIGNNLIEAFKEDITSALSEALK